MYYDYMTSQTINIYGTYLNGCSLFVLAAAAATYNYQYATSASTSNSTTATSLVQAPSTPANFKSEQPQPQTC